jgi:probable phosphomutase (TIGR03848 family)
LDGKFVLQTTEVKWSSVKTLTTYRQHDEAEKVIQRLKQVIPVRPIRQWRIHIIRHPLSLWLGCVIIILPEGRRQGVEMTTLVLIRHATNDWVRKGLLAGWTPGVRLNEEGRAQAQALGERLASSQLDAVYSSPLERALETAKAVAAPHGLDVQIREEIGEVQYGEWNGQPLRALLKKPLWTAVQVYPSGTRFPGGETIGEMQARVVAALDEIRSVHPKGIVAVVAHADVIKAAVAYYAAVPLDLFQRLVISPASVTIVGFSRFGPRLLRMNDTGELKLEHKPSQKPRRRIRRRKMAGLLGPQRSR